MREEEGWKKRGMSIAGRREMKKGGGKGRGRASGHTRE
jgi:hypothetical protein